MAATIAGALNWWARTKGDETALIVGEQQLTYRQLHDWSGRLARALERRGIKPGDRVGLAAPNCLQWPVAAFAVLKCGAVLVPRRRHLLCGIRHGHRLRSAIGAA
jgi:fatty-acyl-CoA synthase